MVDPVLGDGGHAYSTVTPAFIQRMRDLCRQADLILPNCTEVSLLLDTPLPEGEIDPGYRPGPGRQSCLSCPQCGGHRSAHGQLYRLCRGGKDRFVLKKLHLDRNFPGTGGICTAQCWSARFCRATP